MNFTSNGNFAIHVTDLDQARTFYQKTLGFTLVGDSNEKLVFETGSIPCNVNKDDKEMAFIPALEVSDYEAAKQFLRTSGCEIIREWPNSMALYLRDPLGQIIEA
jgi:catechol-2,3-dioxygenase